MGVSETLHRCSSPQKPPNSVPRHTQATRQGKNSASPIGAVSRAEPAAERIPIVILQSNKAIERSLSTATPQFADLTEHSQPQANAREP